MGEQRGGLHVSSLVKAYFPVFSASFAATTSSVMAPLSLVFRKPQSRVRSSKLSLTSDCLPASLSMTASMVLLMISEVFSTDWATFLVWLPCSIFQNHL